MSVAEKPIRARLDEVELQISARLSSTWLHRTDQPLTEIVREGYFADCVELGFRRGDTIQVVPWTLGSYATLCVDYVTRPQAGNPGEMGVLVLAVFKPRVKP
jgi:hypothetical protein